MKWRIRSELAVILAVVILYLEGCSSWPLGEGSSAAQEAAEERHIIDYAVARVYPALVRIHVVTAEAYDGRLRKYESAGSGVIISKQGHVITNHHVAGKARRLVCRLPEGEEIEATLVGSDPLSDIAVLQLDPEQCSQRDKALPVAVFGDSDRVRVGDTVLAMGSPASISQSVTKGIVSNTIMIIPAFSWPFSFELDGEQVGSLVPWIAHDARISGGSSGGPLVNLDGEIVGINEIQMGLSGAIPANFARAVAEELMAAGEVTRGWTGLECQPRLKNSQIDGGVLVSGVIEGSPAAEAGIRPGDVIRAFDGFAVDARIREDLPAFNRLLASTYVGKKVEVVVVREGEERTFSLTVDPAERAEGEDVEVRSWGITAKDFTLMSSLERKRPDKDGVLVDSVRPGGPSGEAKPPLQRDDVLLEVAGRPVRSTAELREISQELSEGEDEPVAALVGFERNGEKLLTVVKIGREPPEERPILSKKAWLSVATQVLTSDLAKALGLEGTPGVRVTQVYPGLSAEKAGLQVGDVLLKIDGETIDAVHREDVEVFRAMVRQYKIGSEVTFDVVRDGEQMKLAAGLEEPPTPSPELKRYEDPNFELTIRDLSFWDRLSGKLGEGEQGVRIDRVEHAGWAALAHVAIGDVLLAVDGVPTPDVDSAEALLKGAAEAQRDGVTFFVRRGIHTMYLELEPNWDDGGR